MTIEKIKAVEKEIDSAFSESRLLDIGYTQAVWTLLSVVEDHHFNISVYNPLKDQELGIYVDGLMNSLTYPLQICRQKAQVTSAKLNKNLIDDDYTNATEWIDRASDYLNFCSIFPLYYNHEIELQVSGNRLVTTDWSSYDLSYEAYDRFINRRQENEFEPNDPNNVAPSVFALTKITKNSFSLNFNTKLVRELKIHLKDTHEGRFSLPKDWEFKYFTIRDFMCVFTTIQAMSYGWFLARQFACNNGVNALGYKNALWTIGKAELVSMLIRYTKITSVKILKIIEYLTFGEVDIKHPDIAIQPIVDLKNGEYAISPFVWLNVNCERNLCVLLNQIKEEQLIYSCLVNEKEEKLRTEIKNKLHGLGFEFKSGKIENTDIDLALIDHKRKKCLSLELKWFIEPAEIREVIQRTEEVKKGVTQAQTIMTAWSNGDNRLIKTVLNVDNSYDFLAVVAPVNFIGDHSAQDMKIPVIRIWHLIDEILKSKDIGQVMEWLKSRNYLPKLDVDFKIKKVEITSGNWCSTWYGIAYV